MREGWLRLSSTIMRHSRISWHASMKITNNNLTLFARGAFNIFSYFVCHFRWLNFNLEICNKYLLYGEKIDRRVVKPFKIFFRVFIIFCRWPQHDAQQQIRQSGSRKCWLKFFKCFLSMMAGFSDLEKSPRRCRWRSRFGGWIEIF